VIARSYGTTLAAFNHGRAAPDAVPTLATSAGAIQRETTRPSSQPRAADVRAASTAATVGSGTN